MESRASAPGSLHAVASADEVIGKLRRVPLREVWAHEALDFTMWLEENVDVLNDVVDITLENVERERAAGAFSIDLVAEDDSGNPVVIENQLEKSNHDHLGKLVTYLAAMEAKAAIWIVSEPRPEHIRAVGWLNESSADFYLLKVEAIRIGDSPPAPLLTLIVGPSEETRQVGATKKQFGERYELRLHWWTALLERAKEKTQLHGGISPGRYSWVGTGAGKGGLTFNYLARQNETMAELYIDRGQGKEEENLEILEALREHQEQIERDFGEPLSWQSLEGKRACRVRAPATEGGYRDPEERWPEIQDAVIEQMIRLEAALGRRVEALSV